MKLIVNRESNPALRSKIRRGFAEKDSKAYMLLLELLSHQSGFSTSKEHLCNLLGWTSKIWKDEAKKLEERGHLFRYRQTGTNNWTFVVYENPQEPTKKVEAKSTKKEKTKKEEPIVTEIKFEEYLDESTEVKVQEKKQENIFEVKEKVLTLNTEIPHQPENSLFTPEEWLAIHTKNKSDEKNSKTKEARRERESSGIDFFERNRASS